MTYKLIEGPLQEPITLNEAKAWMKVEINDDDAIITALISEARTFIEDQTNRALFVQTWDLVLDEMPSVLRLHITPLRSVTGMYYTDIEGVEWTEDDDYYIVDDYNDRIILKQQYTYLGVNFARDYNGWRIRFVAGETQYPDWSKQLTKRLVGWMYDNRNTEISPEIMEDIRKHKVRWI
jgi:uncharacterized phiE125 gp8 family phage protein